MYKSINIYWSTLDYISTAKYQDMFAAFLLYKGLYENSCIFNYSISNLSRLSNLSYKTVKRHMEFMFQKNWVRMHENNIVFKDCADIVPTSDKKKIETWRTKIFLTTKQNIKDQLLHMFMVNKQRRVLRLTDVRNSKTKPVYTKAKQNRTIEKRFGKVRPVLCEIANEFVIAYHTIGYYNKMSKSSAFRAMKRLRSKGDIHKRRNYLLIKDNATKNEFLYLQEIYPKTPLMFRDNKIYRILPNSYCVMDKYSNTKLKDDDNEKNLKNFKQNCSHYYNILLSNIYINNESKKESLNQHNTKTNSQYIG